MAVRRWRVLLVGGRAMFRQCLRTHLESLPDVAVVGEAGEEIEAIERARALSADVVVVAAGAPRRGRVEITIALRAAVPLARVIVLGVEGDDARAPCDAVRGGALGYIPATSGVDELVAAIRQVGHGQAALPAEVLSRLVEAAPYDRRELSDRERDVLQLVAQGCKNREIGDALMISESTVRTHLHKILGKLQVTNRVQAAALALEKGGRGLPSPLAP